MLLPGWRIKLDLESEIDTFVEAVHSKLEETLDLEAFCKCGARVDIYTIKNGSCLCGTPITITVGDTNHG